MSEGRIAYLRFVLLRSHPDTAVKEGIVQAAYKLRDDPECAIYDRQRLDEAIGWFETYLLTPTRFSRTKSKGYFRRSTKGISWLKSTATEHIQNMRELSIILEQDGYFVQQITTERPGYIVYEDGHQIVAEPFADTGRR